MHHNLKQIALLGLLLNSFTFACTVKPSVVGKRTGEAAGTSNESDVTKESTSPAGPSSAIEAGESATAATAEQTETKTPPEVPTEPKALSQKSLVNLKSPELLRADLASTLSLSPRELCAELGQLDCFSTHNLTLGGVDAFKAQIFEPIPGINVAAPLAVDRIALSACSKRVDQDLGGEEVVFAKDLTTPSARSAAVTTLYQQTKLRAPDKAELDQLVKFYDAVATTSPAPERDWAILACFTVLTSVESLFY